MKRLNGLFTTAAVLLIGSGAMAYAQSADRPTTPVPRPAARAAAGSLHGVVSDQSGGPVEGATVSAIGATMAFAVTDRKGRFGFDQLPPGAYLLRAHHEGFSLPQRDYVQVSASSRAVKRLEMRRADAPASADDAAPVLLAASLGGDQPAPPGDTEETADATAGAPVGSTHPHSESAWRLRHLRRSVLKETDGVASGELAEAGVDGPDAAPALASLFAALPFSGEINFLGTSAFGGQAQFLNNGIPRGITYVQLGNGTEGSAGWAMQAAVSEGDVSSWIVAGSFTARGPREHAFDLGLSYGAQEYAGGNPAALAVRSDGTRRAGAVYAFDNWAVTPGFHVTYGARVARYDYVSREDLWSPRLGVGLDVGRGMHVRADAWQRMRAPGAEEFLPPQTGGPWLPPERTFSPLVGNEFRVERIRHLELTLERELRNSVIAVRRFFESVDDQLITIFGARSVSETRADVGHYLVGTVGAVDADGWGVKVSTPVSKRLRGSVDYSLTRARWAPAGTATFEPAALSSRRSERDDVHDVATSLEADIAETATRVFFYYRASTAYAREADLAASGLGGRFDLQVKQGLPFMPFRGSEWQVVVGIRDLFRDPLENSSAVYDELLVIRPPKRVMGGVQVKF